MTSRPRDRDSPRHSLFSLVAWIGLTIAGHADAADTSEGPMVLAAASLGEVLPEVGEAWAREGHAAPRFSFDASSRLAKQIEAGLAADVFVSADLDWMDYLDRRRLLAEGSRRVIAGNRLVVVLPAASTLTLADPRPLASPALTHLALAADTVPAGKYGRAALAWAGIAGAVEPKVVNGENVRTVLAWVAAGEADAGIVYATDARAEPRVKAAYTFPVTAHSPIVYPAAVLGGAADPPAARSFLDFLKSAAARPIFEAAGFTWLAGGHPATP